MRHVAVAGIAPAWFNLLELSRLRDAVGRPVYAVSYEESPGLEPALREAFDGEALARRLDTYRSLPPRVRVERDESNSTASDASEPLFVRAVGIDADETAAAVRGLVREGFRRSEPLRIAAIAASAHREATTER